MPEAAGSIWELGDLTEEQIYIWAYKDEIDTEGKLVAIVDGDDWSAEEQVANARLLAASRKLFEACCNYLYGRKDARECEADMRAAVQKAGGH